MRPLGPEAKGEENGEEISPSSSDSGVWESVMSSPRLPAGSAENDFTVIYSPQIASVDSGDSKFFTFFVLKSEGYSGTVPSVQKVGGTGTPRRLVPP